MLRIDGVSAGYGDLAVLRGVSLEIGTQEAVALLGANGAGKTTLLRAVCGLIPLDAGRVELDGEALNGVPAHGIVERGVIMVPEGRALFPFMTVEENLKLGSYSRRARPSRLQNLDRVYGLLPRLAERRRQLAGSLSGGEQQMCAIARGLMARPVILLLDEPSLGLAPLVAREIFALIETLQAEGIAVLLIEQHVEHALRIANRGFVLANGRIAVSGRGQDLLSNPELKRAYMGLKH
jgi:branched-chain amino acid transport system ATP-binding protein